MEKEIINKIIKLYKDGNGLKQISNVLNISQATIYYNLKKQNINLGKPGPKAKIDCNKVKELYLKGNSCKNVAKLLNCGSTIVRKLLKKNNINILSSHMFLRDKNINHSIFATFTKESCYWAGFIAADGCISLKKGYTFEVNLSIKDADHLQKLAKFLNFDKIKIRKKTICLRFNSKELVSDLINNFNIVPKKSLILMPPNISNSYISHFIRGYFDGDGTIGKNIKISRIAILGTQKFLKWIKYNIKNNIIVGNPNIIKIKNIYCLSFNGRIQCSKIAKWFYKDCENLYLERKYNIAQLYIKDLYLQEEKNKLIIDLYNSGKSIYYIVKYLNYSYDKIYNILINAGITVRGARQLNKKDKEAIIILKKEGKNVHEIRKLTGISCLKVCEVVRKYINSGDL